MSTHWTQEDIDRLRNAGMIRDERKSFPPKKAQPNVNASTPQQGYQALGRLKSGEMNETEKKYAARLESLKYAGDVLWWAFEPMNLRLADKCFYRVDFLVLTRSGALEVHEVKGHWVDDALVKIKVAADKFPFRFIAMQLKKGEWMEREF